MPYRIFVVPIRSPEAVEPLNHFLSSSRVLNVDRRWVDLGVDSFWCFCVDYLESPAGTNPIQNSATRPTGQSRSRIDYRDVLTPDQFSRFVALRTLRKSIAEAEAVPVYTIFTNEQLAEMAKGPLSSKADLARIPGVGEARIEKYGERILIGIRQAKELFADAAGGELDGEDSGLGQSSAGPLEGGERQAKPG